MFFNKGTSNFRIKECVYNDGTKKYIIQEKILFTYSDCYSAMQLLHPDRADLQFSFDNLDDAIKRMQEMSENRRNKKAKTVNFYYQKD